MNLKSKVFSLLLVCLMILSASSFMAVSAFDDVPTDHQFYEAVTNLAGREVINGYDDGTFKPENEVSRAEMAKMISVLFTLGSPTITEEPFTDVPVDHWAASFIVAAKNRGIINGMGDGTFQPDGKVTYHQAVKMIVCALNWGVEAESRGGWDGGGYIAVAQQINLLRRASLGRDENAPRGLVAQLLYNSFDINPLVYNPATDSWSADDRTPSDLAGYTKLNNVLVVGVPKIFLDSRVTSCQTNEIWVKSNNVPIKFKTGNVANAASYIGMNVNLQYTENADSGDLTLASLTTAGAPEVIEVKVSDVKSINDSGIEYYTTADRSKVTAFKFDSGETNIIYNERFSGSISSAGVASAAADSAIKALNDDVDNNTNVGALNVDGTVRITKGANTIVKIKSYKSYFVTSSVSVSGTEYTINVDMPGTPSTKAFKIDTNDTHIREAIVKKSTLGNAGTDGYPTVSYGENNLSLLSSLRNNVVSIAESIDSGKSYIEVLVGANSLTNVTINSFTEEHGYKIVELSSKQYKVSKGFGKHYASTYDIVQSGSTGTYYTDAFGLIVWTGTLTSGNYKAGILLDISKSTSGNDDRYTAKFFDLKANSTFTALIEKDIIDAEFAGKPEVFNKLYVMKLTSNTIRKTDDYIVINNKDGSDGKGQTLDGSTYYKALLSDSTYTSGGVTYPKADTKMPNSDDVYPGGKIGYNDVYFRFASSKYQLGFLLDNGTWGYDTGTNPGTLTSVSIYERSDSSVSTNMQTLKKVTSIMGSYRYSGAFYQIVEPSGTGTSTTNYVIYNPIKSITHSTAVWVVNSTRTTGMDNTAVYDVISFNSSAKADKVTIQSSVADTLNLQIGDVFAYYSSGADVNIIDAEAVTIFLRASDALSSSATSAVSGTPRYINNDAGEINEHRLGYDSMSIYQASMKNSTPYNYYGYTLQLPVMYDSTSDTNNPVLYLALEASTVDNASEKSVPRLPKNTNFDYFNFDSTDMLVSNSIEAKGSAFSKVFLYDENITTGNKLVVSDTNNTPAMILDNLITVQQAHKDSLSLNKVDLVYSYVSADSNLNVTGRFLYILRRNQNN